MTKTKSTKSALISSVLALFLCFTMLLGTTFAWFTDSVTSSGNKIEAGTLDVALYLWNGDVSDDANRKEITDESDPIFGANSLVAQNNAADTLWEPGKTQVVYLSIKNNGTLDLKYKVALEVTDVQKNIIDVLEYTITPDATWSTTPVAWAGNGETVVEGTNVTAEDVKLEAETEHFFALSVHMDENAGNEYQDASVTFDIKVLATQVDSETDSFGDDYDADAEYDGINVPEDAIEVADLAGFTEALAAGGNYEITAPFTVEGILNVSADTKLYNTNSANVITFAQNARLMTAENADLALYGVKINGGGSFEMVDGVFTTDATATNSDAILKASAGSTLTLGEGTVIENVVSTAPAVAWAKGTVDNRATIIFEGATVRNCAGGSGTVINVDNYGDVYIEDGTVITGNVSYNQSNHGIIRIYNPWDAENVSTLTMNGGEITDNYFSANGAIGLYYGKMIMNGGEISGNSWYSCSGKTNGFYCVVYVHSQSQFIMNGGEISGNTITDGAINAINSSVEGAITFNGGTVTNNSNTRNDNKDALAAVCYPYSMQKTLVISENANVTGTVYNHAIEGNVVVRNYSEISEYFGE